MRKITTLVIVFTSLLALSWGQEVRYMDPVFSDVEVIENVTYGFNVTILTKFDTSIDETLNLPLLLDFYEPVGDDAEARPLVIIFHTGNFLPPGTNGQPTGTKRDSVDVEVAMRLAKMGYVVASVDYRLGWNPLAPTQPERALQLIQAAYRGLQDGRTAIRYFKQQVEIGNPFGVDTSRITLWGIGTGGYISLVCATIDQFADIVTTTNGPGKFTTDLTGDGIPDPMVNPFWNGDIYGTTYGILPASGFPPFPPFDTLCVPNHVGYSSDFQLGVNMGGALGDIAWLDSSDVPLISYHVPLDGFAPYEDEVLRVPGREDQIVRVQGARLFIEKANQLGLNDVFAGIDDEFTTAAQNNSATAGHDYFEGLFPFNIGPNGVGQVDGSPWDWWNPEVWSSVPNPFMPALSIAQTAALSSVDMMNNPDRGRTYVDTIIGYFAPRGYAALDLVNADQGTPTSLEVLGEDEITITVRPLPADEEVRFTVEGGKMMKNIEVFNVQGSMVRAIEGIHSAEYTLRKQGLQSGIYIARIRFDEGTISRKLIFR